MLPPPAGFASVAGILLPARSGTSGMHGGTAGASALVETPTWRRNLRAAALALCQRRPLLLEGPPGAHLNPNP
jgi:hypothetical protein